MEQQLDTFDSPVMDENEGLDTFDDGSYTDSMPEEEDDGEKGQDTEEVSGQTKGTEEVDPDSQVNLLDEKEEIREEKTEEEPKADPDKSDEKDEKSDESSESESDTEGDAGKDAGDAAEEIRTLKAFRDGKRYEVPEDAEIKVRVNGKSEKVPLSELRDNYSGKVAYDEKFSKFSEEKKSFDTDREVYEQEIDGIRGHMGEIANRVKGAMAGERSPNEAMEYLLDLMGADTLQYSKAMFERQAEEFDIYSQMTEVERDSYWTKKENEHLTKRQESLINRQNTEKTQAEFSNKVNSLREAHGISEDDYVSAEQDLKAEGKETTPENIILAAQLTPLLETADALVEKYLDQLTDADADSLVVDIASQMHKTPELTVEQVRTLLAEQFEVEDIMTQIEEKAGKKEDLKVGKSIRTAELESFDDFDNF